MHILKIHKRRSNRRLDTFSVSFYNTFVVKLLSSSFLWGEENLCTYVRCIQSSTMSSLFMTCNFSTFHMRSLIRYACTSCTCVSISQDMCKCECILFCRSLSVPPPRLNGIAVDDTTKWNRFVCCGTCCMAINMANGNPASIQWLTNSLKTSNIIRAIFQRARYVESFNKVALTESQFKMSQRVAFSFVSSNFSSLCELYRNISSMHTCMSCSAPQKPQSTTGDFT